MNRLHSLASAGFEPTNEEYSQAGQWSTWRTWWLKELLRRQYQAETGQPEAATGHGQADNSRARALGEVTERFVRWRL